MLQIADNPALHAASIYIALLVLGLVPLSLAVIRVRRGERIGIGDGGNRDLARLVRVHANYAEYTPFGLALLIALPLTGAPAWCVHAVGLALVIGRAAHAYGLSRTIGSSPGRVIGMVLTLSALIFGALVLMVRALS
jgi:uncharacterized protein